MRVWSLIIGAGLLLTAILASVAMGLPVLSAEGTEWGYRSMTASWGGFSGEAAYDNIDDEGSAQLQAAWPLLLAGLIVSAVAGGALVALSFVRVPGPVLVVGVAVGVVGAVLVLLGPVMVGVGASAMTDGAVDGEHGVAGYWLALSGTMVAGVATLVGGLWCLATGPLGQKAETA